MLNQIIQITGAVFGVLLISTGVFLVNLIWFRPWSLNLFYEKILVRFALENPEMLSSIGIAEQFGYRAHNAKLSDSSIEKKRHHLEQLHRSLRDLRAYDFARQSSSQQLSTRVLTWFLTSGVEGERFAFYDYPVNQVFGVQNTLPDFMANIHRVPDAKGAEHYLARLGEWGRKFDQVIAGLQYREERGVIPPRFVVQRVLTGMRAFVAKPARENILATSFAQKIDAVGALDAAKKMAFKTRVETAITTHVYPAYQRLIDYMAMLESKATTDDGVWKLPEGEAYYAQALRAFTTTRMSPSEVHELGLREVARIDTEMRTILERLGHTGETPAQWLLKLKTDPHFLYSNDAAGRAEAIAGYKKIIDDCLQVTPRFFGLQPKGKIDVQRVPEFKEATAPAAYYQHPALDGSRPGVFFANLRDMAEVEKFSMKTLAYHEGVPGHHFQITIAQELRGLPTFRSMLPFTAYTEGWALYTEWFAKEMGLYQDDLYADLGRLQGEMFRAVRLVVDTGIHSMRWTRERAIAYMVEKTGMKESQVVSEIERYIVLPGQACAYKLGMITIQKLRARAQQKLGAQFSDKAFHDVVLGNGPLPLEILEDVVDAWLARGAQTTF